MVVNGNLTFHTLGDSELQNAIIERLGSDPTGAAGRIYYNSSSNVYRWYDGTTWVTFGSSNAQTEVDNMQTASGGIYNTDGTYNATNVDALSNVTGSTDLLDALSQLDSAISVAAGVDEIHELTDVASDTTSTASTGDLFFWTGSIWDNTGFGGEPSDNALLQWNATTDVWETVTPSSIGGFSFGTINGDTGSATADNTSDDISLVGLAAGGITTVAAEGTPDTVSFSMTPIDLALGGATLALNDFIIVSDSADGATTSPQRYQFSDIVNDLDIPNAITSDGLVVRTASDTYASRTIQVVGAGAFDGLVISNGDGVAGDPTIGFDIDNLPAAASAPIGADAFVVFDGSANEKVTMTQLASFLQGATSLDDLSDVTDGTAHTNATSYVFVGDGTNLVVTDFTTASANNDFQEAIEDIVGGLGTNGTNTTFVYNDVANTIQWDVDDVFVLTAGDTMTGDLTMSGSSQILLNNGSLSDPAIAFTSNTDMGIFSAAGATLDFSVDGGNVLSLSPSAVTSGTSVTFRSGGDGTAGAPAYSFVNGTDAGMYLADGGGNDDLAFSAGGTQRLLVNAINGALSVAGTASYETLIGAYDSLNATDMDYLPNAQWVSDQLDTYFLPLAGGTMTGDITMSGGTKITLPDVPASATDAVNKSYVDNLVTSGAVWIDPISNPDLVGIATEEPTDGAADYGLMEGAPLISGAYIAYGGSYPQYWANTDITGSVVSRTGATDTIIVSGDLTGTGDEGLEIGDKFRLTGASSENGIYTVATISYGAPNTTITTVEDITTDTGASGTVYGTWEVDEYDVLHWTFGNWEISSNIDGAISNPRFGAGIFTDAIDDNYPLPFELYASQDETNYDGTGDNGTFVGGTGHANSDVITMSDGSTITVDNNAAGVVTEFTITTVGTGTQLPADGILTQTGTTGSGTGFTMTPSLDPHGVNVRRDVLRDDIVEYVGGTGGNPLLNSSWTTPHGRACGCTYDVDSLTSGTKTFVINASEGDLTNIFFANNEFVYAGGTPGTSDGTYTIVSSSWTGTNTEVVVEETIPATTTGGTAETQIADGITTLVSNTNDSHFGQSYLYNQATMMWVQISGPGNVDAGIGLSYSGTTLNVNLGAGIRENPSDEVGLDIAGYTSSALGFSNDSGATKVANEDSATAASELALFLDGSTLTQSGSGIKVSTSGITNNEMANPTWIVSGDGGADQTVTLGDTLNINGATDSGIVVTGVATDIVTIDLNINTLTDTAVEDTDFAIFEDTSAGPGVNRQRSWADLITDLNIATTAGGGSLSASNGVKLVGSTDFQMAIDGTGGLSAATIEGADFLAFDDNSDGGGGTNKKTTVTNFLADLNIATTTGGGALTASNGVELTGNDFAVSIDGLTTQTIATNDLLIFDDGATGTNAKTTVQSFLDTLNIVHDTGGNGIVIQTAADTYAAKAITASATPSELGLTVTNGDGTGGGSIEVGLDIDGLTDLGGSPATADTIAIFDDDGNVNRKVSVADLANAVAGATSTAELSDVTASATVEGQVLVADGSNDYTPQVVQFIYDFTGTAKTTHTVSHGLNQKYVNVTVFDTSDNVIIPQSITLTDANTVTVVFNTAIQCRVVVIGFEGVAVTNVT